MFKAILKVQWKWTRIWILFATIFAFAIPVGTVRLFGEAVEFYDGRPPSPGQIIRAMQSAGVVYSMLAAALGLAVAFTAWSSDHKGRHVYALSLPISRARYALMRFAAGSLFLLIPCAGLLLGALIATAIIDLPAGMHAYPLQLTARFLLAAFVAFAIFFSIAGASQRAAATMLGIIAAGFVVAVGLGAMGVKTDFIGIFARVIFVEPGVLSIFTGRWMLIDV
jgi:hypothetical protein